MNNSSFNRLFIVILFETALFMLMGSVDTMMLSAYSDDAVTAVSNANQALNLMNMLFTILSTGAIIVISQYIGAKKYKEAHDISLHSLLLSFLFGGILSILFLTFNKTILHLLNVPDIVFNDSHSYSMIVGSIMAITATNPVMSAIFRGFHKAKISLYISLLANVINVIGDAGFIFGIYGFPKLGVVGVAYSTSFAILFRSTISLFLIFTYLKVRPTKQFLSKSRNYIFQILKVGSPSALEGIIYNVMQLVIVSMVNLIADNAMAIRTYVLNLTMFIYLGSLALSQTNQIFVGNYIGSNEKEAAYKMTNKTFIKALVISMSMTLLFNLFGKQLIGLFTKDPTIIHIARQLLLMTFIVEFGRALNLVYASAFKGAGAVKFPLVTAFIFMLGACIPLTYLFTQVLSFGLIGVWIAYAFDETSRGLIAIYYWHKKTWMKKNIIGIKN